MKRALAVAVVVLSALVVRPAAAFADLTAFVGFAPEPSTRTSHGIAVGVNLLIVGFEVEYSRITEDDLQAAPGLTSGMGNILVMTPTVGFQVYGTIGAGLFHESLGDVGTTSVGTNVGGGLKLSLVGPIRLRLDYRLFTLAANPLDKRVQRLYAGANLSF
jgi:hypothetical protein